MRARVGLAAGLGFLLIAVVALVVLTGRVEHRTGSNASTSVSGLAVTVPATRKTCQRQSVPADSRQFTVYGARRRGAGPLQIAIATAGGRVVSRGRIRSFPAETAYDVPLRPPIKREIGRALICFDNDGIRNVAFAGNRTPPLGPANPNQNFVQDDVRVDFSEGKRSSRISLAGSVAHRMTLQKSAVLGSWTLWAALVLTLLGWAAAIRLILMKAGE